MSTSLLSDPFAYELRPVKGILDDREDKFFVRWRVEIEFLDKILGGHPKNPDILFAWLRSRMTNEDELKQELRGHLEEQGVDVSQDATIEQLHAQLKSLGEKQYGVGFLADSAGIYMPARCSKAMLKEATNVRFPQGQHKWGSYKTTKRDAQGTVSEKETGGKAPRSVVAERIYVEGSRLHFYRTDAGGQRSNYPKADGTLLHVGHPKDRFGETTSTLSHFDYLVQPKLSFVIRSFPDYPTEEDVLEILTVSQMLGLWAGRSMSYGQFKVTGFDRI